MSKSNADILYYENTDFSKLISSKNKKKYYGTRTKRITINISQDAYVEAHNLDKYMNMGYQNVLKAAMILGIKNLYDSISTRKLKLINQKK